MRHEYPCGACGKSIQSRSFYVVYEAPKAGIQVTEPKNWVYLHRDPKAQFFEDDKCLWIWEVEHWRGSSYRRITRQTLGRLLQASQTLDRLLQAK